MMNNFAASMALIFSFSAALANTGPKVAILPTINASGEKSESLRVAQTSRADTYLNNEFRSRGFDVIPLASLRGTLNAMKIDISDEELWKRETLYRIAEKTGADYVLFDVITANGQHTSPNFFTRTAEGWADVKVWLVKASDRSAILSAKVYRGSSKHSEVIFGSVKGSDLQTLAVANGLRDALKSFFGDYLKVK